MHRSAAEEQLELVKSGSDPLLLQSALEFGKWVKLKTSNLSSARNHFKAVQDERRRNEAEKERRRGLGLAS